ncbi:MAG: hypothetical protein AAGA54_02120 [Myxococcota bacterium]
MNHWNADFVVNLLALAVLLGLAAGLRNRIAPLRRLRVPDSIVAGAAGLLLGPSVLDVIPFSIPNLELLVYHGFALVFIAVALQRAAPGARPGGARSIAVAIPSISILQVTLALLIVFAWTLVEPLHPGFTLMPMLGFSQGPGQALSLGGAWESLGFTDGAQLGLTFAALGFASCCVLGIPVVAVARRRGWVHGYQDAEAEVAVATTEGSSHSTMEPLTSSVVAIALVYAAVFGVISALVTVLPDGLIATAWGFHFIFGALIAMGLRRAAVAAKAEHMFHDRLLSRLAVLAVDVTTVAALSAVKLSVLGAFWLPILVLTVVLSAATLLACLWMARRVFPQEPFEHALLMFGMATGTLPTGLALLRILDPQLRGTVARNATLGVSGSIPFMAPLLVGVLPFAVSLWPEGTTTALGIPLGLMVLYAVGLAIAWRTVTPAQRRGRWTSLWPGDDDA